MKLISAMGKTFTCPRPANILIPSSSGNGEAITIPANAYIK